MRSFSRGRRSLKSSSRVGASFFGGPKTRARFFAPTRISNATRQRQAGVQALRLVKKMRREEEIKEHNTSGTFTTDNGDVWAAGTYLNDIDVGNTSETRIGNKIVLKNLRIRWQAVFNIAETTVNALRIVILVDRKPDGALPTGAQIFNQNSILGNINSADPEFAGRFQLLADKTIGIGQGTQGIMVPRNKHITPLYIQKDIKTMYNASGGGIADCMKGSLLMFMCSGTASHAVEVIWNAKIKYADS